jgi:hypothetical protein
LTWTAISSNSEIQVLEHRTERILPRTPWILWLGAAFLVLPFLPLISLFATGHTEPRVTSAASQEIHVSTTPPQSQHRHIGPARLYPTPRFTPGKADTLITAVLNRTYNCKTGPCTYSRFHRPELKSATKRNVYETYGYEPGDHPSGEVDHVYPLCAGGSNDEANLWFQPEDNSWNGQNFGYKEKDALEAWVCRMIKVGKLEPKEAYAELVGDWVKYYMEVDPQGRNGDETDDDETVPEQP